MLIEEISYKGKSIIYVDYTGCFSQDQMVSLHKEVVKTLEGVDGNENLLLINYTNTFVGNEYMKLIKEANPLYDRKLKKRAIFGVTEVQQLLVDSFNKIAKKKVVIFDSKQEAMDYLVN